jgi:putative endonuclease
MAGGALPRFDFFPVRDVSSPGEELDPRMKPRYKRMLEGMKAGGVRESGPAPASVWFLYILKCGDGTFYTGVTNDVERRLLAHREGRGARYTRARLPVELIYRESCGPRADALRRECAVKSLGRQAKEALISGVSPIRPKRDDD